MSLLLETVTVREVALGTRDGWHAGRLEVDEGSLADRVAQVNDDITRVIPHLVLPGEAARLHCCKDVVQPAVKLDGAGPGEGRSRVLANLAVVTLGPIVGFQEGIIDMNGPGAQHTPFSQMPLLALEIEVREGVSPWAHEAALRQAGLAAGEHLARLCGDAEPDAVEELRWNTDAVDPELPRIAYVCMVLSQGLLHDTWVLGRDAKEGLPRLLDPRAILDGGIVSGNCVSACDKNSTWHHRNNPVVRELLDGHGSRWCFAGVVVTNQPVRLAEKERSARRAVALARELAPQGVIVTKEGFGNPDSDFVMILGLLERAGIACVGVTDEFAGDDGGSQSLADAVPEARAIVSTGNANQRLVLPPMARTLGPVPEVSRLAGGYAGSLKEDGSLEVELQAIMGATNELGHGRLSAREV